MTPIPRLESRPTLSVIVPTYREAANVPVLFERLKTALAGLPWEMIVVDDDSPDGTADVAYAIARRDPRLRCLRRVNRLGLAGAVIEGWLASSADFVAVIDGDLQHDEAILPQMYAALVEGRGDLAIGTRVADPNAAARPVAGAPEAERARRLVLPPGRRARRVSDPMSGFFMIRREIVGAIGAASVARRLQDPRRRRALVAAAGLKIVEIPYVFRPRQAGESKLSPLVGIDFLGLVVHHATGGLLPIRFVLFASIGAFGLVVHLLRADGLIESRRPRRFRAGQTRRDDRRDGQQFRAQQRDHLSRLSLSRPRR